MMAREEAIAILQEKYDYIKSFYDLAAHPEEDYPETAKYLQALQIALSALRPITREQVERMRGEWQQNRQAIIDSVVCAKCGTTFQVYYRDYPYCPRCGAPMTDEAVDMVMERLEALHSETKTD